MYKNNLRPRNLKLVTYLLLQFVLKCLLRLRPESQDYIESEKTDSCSPEELCFLKKIYEDIKDALVDSSNCTTAYSPKGISQSQASRGSSLETSSQRSRYIALCTNGATSEVLNISFKNKQKFSRPLAEVRQASSSVVRFLLSDQTSYRNEYSTSQFNSMVLNWNDQSSEPCHVPGGLLFPVLTTALLSLRHEDGITVVVESYGGKKRGKHVYWKFGEASPAEIMKIVDEVNKSEEKKIPFIIRNVFRILQLNRPSSVTHLSIHWGLGCDAMGSKITINEPSFLVCQPVQIEAIDTCRSGLTKNVFKRGRDDTVTHLSSAVTHRAASSSASKSDEDSDEDPIRYR